MRKSIQEFVRSDVLGVTERAGVRQVVFLDVNVPGQQLVIVDVGGRRKDKVAPLADPDAVSHSQYGGFNPFKGSGLRHFACKATHFPVKARGADDHRIEFYCACGKFAAVFACVPHAG
jgi:hypothetical protein